MLAHIIRYSVRHKLIVLLIFSGVLGTGLYALFNISIGAVPDITNNQVQVITTSRSLATEDVEKFLTYPVELEMANLPGVKEIRSISKFGLSVVTVVFDDNMGSYLPRQLIAEKIKSAEQRIPAGFGKPFMGPITTGLGEIYQYVIEVDPAYKDVYTLADLRTIQDWIIRRQLSGIPGVVEVNTWGGQLKQYEVAVDPERLRSMGLSLLQIFSALEKNNSVTGGGYIEKSDQAYFLRGQGLAQSLQDIENIVVANRNGVPVYMRDVGRVGFGHATRFGAITGNGEGEKVLGQVMMLKGANVGAVIKAVKERVAHISPSLPPGIRINPFLERSELIEKTTATIAENLTLGCLIVVFVVVLLIGDIRSGIVVASVIPLSLLFALSLMYLFDIDANLMSLGAIDFGIIIDGAVIVVEYISFQLASRRAEWLSLPAIQRRSWVETITCKGANKMMRSAVFGQLIIIIVFLPILSLAGIEGKMFKPMALVFCFALLGAIALCVTYVPVMAALLIVPSDPDRKTLSRRFITFLTRLYVPSVTWALKRKKTTLGIAAALLLAAIGVFTRMGGEFVPTLDEGDFVIQPVLKTGVSLSRTVEATTKMERILARFPEVEQVISRIGAAEVPTDPMSMEDSDVIVKLSPREEWVSADSKDELADKFKEALAEMPDMEMEFTQPIEMRFNELITGVKADLAIKVFGEDLDILYRKGLEIEKAIADVAGAADVTVEKTVGLPQIAVRYNRQQVARYGLAIDDLNRIIGVGFGGVPAGSVFDGEKAFDLVVRFDSAHRRDLSDIAKTTVRLPNGAYLPLDELATVSYTEGPAKISRDNTRRRVVVSVNVRNRDLESVVEDVQKIVKERVKLPLGYTVEYGGQFEHLRKAKKRLYIAAPIALALIFVLLYFAFKSVREALIIYSAIPMATVGGVFLLYARGMPFSISAGVGFIALFGIAVLNGIVLIEEFKALKAQGMENLYERILTGAKNRLRPVLLTASAAAMGFLPMALSTSAGAEVQRPLATVVVGGLVSATTLTLIALPVLYALWGQKRMPLHGIGVAVVALLWAWPTALSAQPKLIDASQAVAMALRHNLLLKAASQRVIAQQQRIKSAVDIEKTKLFYSYNENDIAPNGLPLRVIGLSQSLRFPTVYAGRRKALQGEALMERNSYTIAKRTVAKEALKAYYDVVYRQQTLRQYAYLDSLYTRFARAAAQRFEEGATTYLEKLTADSKHKTIEIELHKAEENVRKAYIKLSRWLQYDSAYRVVDSVLTQLPLQPLDTIDHPGIRRRANAVDLSKRRVALAKQKLLPSLHFSLFRGANDGPNTRVYSGFQAGLAIPLWFGSQKSSIQVAQTSKNIAEAAYDDYRIQLAARYRALVSDLKKFEEGISYYRTTGKRLSQELVAHARKAFQSGEIDFLQYTLLLEHARSIEMDYLSSLFQYNMTVLEANYIID